MATCDGTAHEQQQPRDIPAACDHRLLQPRWDRLEDMGHDELASSYLCEACGENFGTEEGRNLREAATRTLHNL